VLYFAIADWKEKTNCFNLVYASKDENIQPVTGTVVFFKPIMEMLCYIVTT